MQAIVHHKYGSADVLELRDIGKPGVRDDDVLVRVHAAGVDRLPAPPFRVFASPPAAMHVVQSWD